MNSGQMRKVRRRLTALIDAERSQPAIHRDHHRLRRLYALRWYGERGIARERHHYDQWLGLLRGEGVLE